MKKRPSQFLHKSMDSLLLAVEHFNRPWDRGRPEAVLILLDRAFELVMKAIILHRGGRIREPYATETIGHEKCVRKCITEEPIRCISETQGLTIQIINSFRDAAQHDIIDLSENELYMYCQAGVTLYRDLLRAVFDTELGEHLPGRVLPVSTQPPRDFAAMVEADFEEIRRLLRPNARRQAEARAKIKSLAIVESSLSGVRAQPSEFEMRRFVREIKAGTDWPTLFPGVSSLRLDTTGEGISVDIRITKKEGDAVHLVPEGTPGANVLAVKRVNELDYYSLGLKSLAEKLALTEPKTGALVWKLGLQQSDEYFKIVKIGKSEFKRYSPKALERLKEALGEHSVHEVWGEYRARSR